MSKLERLPVGQRVCLLKDAGTYFPKGSVGTVVEDVTGKRIGRESMQLVPLGHCYRVMFDHRPNMPATYIRRDVMTAIDKADKRPCRLRHPGGSEVVVCSCKSPDDCPLGPLEGGS